jgi:glycosyltransferase involved in cell wall biosynthesis
MCAKMRKINPVIIQMGNDINIPSNGIITVMKTINRSVYLNGKYEIDFIYFSFPTYTKIRKLTGAITAFCRFVTSISKSDLVHIHHSTGFNFFMTMFFTFTSVFCRKIVILHNHAGDFFSFYQSRPNIIKLLIRRTYGLAHACIVLSKSFEELFYNSLGRNIRSVVLRNPSPVKIPSIPNSDIRKESTVNVLYMNHLQEKKGVYDLLDIIPRLLRSYPNIYFVIAGDGEIAEVSKIVESNGWNAHVAILGWIDGERKIDVLRNTDIFVLPSYHEGLPMALLEAMTFGIAPVVTDVGGIPEVIRDGKNGLLVKAGDKSSLAKAISLLSSDRQFRAEIGRAAYGTIQDSYSVDRYVHTLSELYQSLLATTAGSPISTSQAIQHK